MISISLKQSRRMIAVSYLVIFVGVASFLLGYQNFCTAVFVFAALLQALVLHLRCPQCGKRIMIGVAERSWLTSRLNHHAFPPEICERCNCNLTEEPPNIEFTLKKFFGP